jgi:sulfate permease, SulP family
VKEEWFGNIKGDLLAGIVVALALIPEAIAFSIIAGVDPMVGLHASFLIAVIISFAGGRPAMISAATGAMALVMVTLVADYGVQYLFAATVLTGVLQMIFGILKLARFMKFIPRSVMIGFVNALAILIFTSQLPHFSGESFEMYVMVGGSLAIIYLLPLATKAVPSPLIAIIVVTVFAISVGSDVRTVGDMGALKQELPLFSIPRVPFNFETLSIIFPYSLALSIVGLLESLLTASIVDDMTDTDSDKNRESRGQGIANVATGFFGGMAGCAMIGQSVINVKSGGRSRFSTFIAGMFLMFLILVLGEWVVQIPMAALVGVMFMVSFSTFDWSSLKNLTFMPRADAVVMVVTVVTVVLTHDLSKGVFAGVVLSALFFANNVSKIKVESEMIKEKNKTIYYIYGQLFFASVTDLLAAFDFKENDSSVEIDLTEAQIWDDSAVGALDKIITKFKEHNVNVTITGLNKKSSTLLEKLSMYY